MSVKDVILSCVDAINENDFKSRQEYLEEVVSAIYELPNCETLYESWTDDVKKWFDDAVDIIYHTAGLKHFQKQQSGD